MKNICKIVVSLYPPDFREVFGDEIVAEFTDHYQAEHAQGRSRARVLFAQLHDLLNLFASAAAMRATSRSNRSIQLSSAGQPEAGTPERIQVYKAFFAWQAAKEAEWLERMSDAGWEFIDYWPWWYEFSRLPAPKPYRFQFERALFLPGSRAERQFLKSKEAAGWEYFHNFAGWYYFRNPKGGAASPVASDPAAVLEGEMMRLASKPGQLRNSTWLPSIILCTLGIGLTIAWAFDPHDHFAAIIVGAMDFLLGVLLIPRRPQRS